MCANSEGSGETAQMCRLAWAFAGRLCDKHHNLMSWLKLDFLFPQAEQQSSQEQMNDINSADKFINKDPAVSETENKEIEEMDTVNDGKGGSVTVIKMEEIQPSTNESDKDRAVIDGQTSVSTTSEPNVNDPGMSVVEISETGDKDVMKEGCGGESELNGENIENTETAERDEVAEAVQGKFFCFGRRVDLCKILLTCIIGFIFFSNPGALADRRKYGCSVFTIDRE